MQIEVPSILMQPLHFICLQEVNPFRTTHEYKFKEQVQK